MSKTITSLVVSIVSTGLLALGISFSRHLLRRLLFESGLGGICPISSLVIAGALTTSFIAVSGVFAGTALRVWVKSRLFIWIIAWGTVAIVVAILLIRSYLRHGLMEAYCSGFAARIARYADVSQLEGWFYKLANSSQTNYVILSAADLDRSLEKVMKTRGTLVTLPSPIVSPKTSEMILLWKCFGGGVGLYYGASAPPERTCLDRSIRLTNSVWVIVRGE